jgi:hypothetical protein
MLEREIMQTVVRDRSSPWKRAVETLLARKKQLLEDITKKQILTNRWKLEERERQEFEKALGWSKFSKEDTTRVELGEIRQRTATGFTLQEILPHGDHPHPGINQAEMDPHLQVTHSLSTEMTRYDIWASSSHRMETGKIWSEEFWMKQGKPATS